MKGSELISEYAEHEAQKPQATERERELVRRALQKDQVSRELAQLQQEKDSAKTKNDSPAKSEDQEHPTESN